MVKDPKKRDWMDEVGIKEFKRPMKYSTKGGRWLLSEAYINETPLEKLKARFADCRDEDGPKLID